jgi:hypothetical protein
MLCQRRVSTLEAEPQCGVARSSNPTAQDLRTVNTLTTSRLAGCKVHLCSSLISKPLTSRYRYRSLCSCSEWPCTWSSELLGRPASGELPPDSWRGLADLRDASGYHAFRCSRIASPRLWHLSTAGTGLYRVVQWNQWKRKWMGQKLRNQVDFQAGLLLGSL